MPASMPADRRKDEENIFDQKDDVFGRKIGSSRMEEEAAWQIKGLEIAIDDFNYFYFML